MGHREGEGRILVAVTGWRIVLNDPWPRGPDQVLMPEINVEFKIT